MKKYIVLTGVTIIFFWSCLTPNNRLDSVANTKTIDSIAAQFTVPPMAYRPYVWWHWMGSNFSKEGIRKDLEAMKEAGIGGATIFNLASAVQESHKPVENNPWPEQTYRSVAYWEALEYAMQEASLLGLKLGIHNSPGYATTGGPWITEERGMQKIVYSQKVVQGGKNIRIQLKRPELPIYHGLGSTERRASFYRDIAVMAVPENIKSVRNDILDISACFDSTGWLNWSVPAGKWTIFRIGHAPTMANPHPLPDDLIGEALEVDKMSAEQSVYHWQQVLQPLIDHLQKYVGTTFTHILVDSYEASKQDWTPGFRESFIKIKGYDPLPYIALKQYDIENDSVEIFEEDNKDVISRLYIDNGWKIAKEMINKAGLQFYWEPYWGPFDTEECVAIPDLPMSEFWTKGNSAISKEIVAKAQQNGQNIVGAEALTGRPEISRYTEDPAFLKRPADENFLTGVNFLFLHHWVHQPFDDQYQPGMGMGWWGTHFGRHQTWIKPGKAFFSYLSRCQMLLQQGRLVSIEGNVLHREMVDADIYFIINPTDSMSQESVVSPYKERTAELWDAYHGVIKACSSQQVTLDSLFVTVSLNPGESMFVVLPAKETSYAKEPAYLVKSEKVIPLDQVWDVTFAPKLGTSFERKNFELTDFSKSSDPEIQYFSGTAVYRKTVSYSSENHKSEKVWLNIGEMDDIASVRINGKEVGVMWFPPYKIEITDWIKPGDNDLEILVTNNWANCLIGDERFPADFEWGEDRGIELGRSIKGFPEWFVKGEPRPSKDRKTFLIWSYYRENSLLQPAGLKGPVRINIQEIE